MRAREPFPILLREPVDEVWGERRAYYADPDGTTLHIAMKLSP